ncbi:MAG: hypothetical protein ACI30S_03225 [Muribaculaceae bacterium]
MKGKAFKLFGKVALFASTITFFTNCGGSDTGLFPPAQYSSEFIEDYVATKAALQDTMPSDICAYIDFSDGVNLAYDDADTKEVLRTILNSLSGSSCAYFRLADSKMDTIQGTPEDIFNKAIDPKEYLKQKAPIRTALEQIIADGKPAVLITDYEEYDGNKIMKNAFAKRFFVDWLKKDRNITFLIVDYKEKGKDKKLFFTIFDGNPNRLIDKITSALQGKPENYKKFVMSNSYYEVKTNYPAANKGGNYHGEDGLDNVTCVQEDISMEDRYIAMPKFKAEYYPLTVPYSDVVSNGYAMQYESKPYPPYSYTYFIQGFYFDFTHFAYDDVELDVKVSNAQADYTNYFNYVYAENQRANHVEGAEDNYFDIYGNNKFPYAEAPMSEVKDMFKLEDDPSEKYPSPVTFDGFREYGLDFDWEKFGDGTQINGAELGDLLRVDIVIADVDDKDADELEPLFKWGDYDNLSESVRLALQEVRPIGKVVYTFYIHAQY